jgi:hypothetical protein
MRLSRNTALRLVLLICSILLVGASICGQSSKKLKPDFSGTWVLDRSKSSKAINFDETLVIDHQDPEIRITRRITARDYERVEKLTYYIDGRGEVNPSELDGKPVKTKTRWDGKKLVSKESTTTSAGDLPIYVDVTEVWQISTDGRLLTLKTTPMMRPVGNAMIVPQGEVDTNRVFARELTQPANAP